MKINQAGVGFVTNKVLPILFKDQKVIVFHLDANGDVKKSTNKQENEVTLPSVKELNETIYMTGYTFIEGETKTVSRSEEKRIKEIKKGKK
jgi:hypothetical protein